MIDVPGGDRGGPNEASEASPKQKQHADCREALAAWRRLIKCSSH